MHKKKKLSLTIEDVETVEKSYMPFIKNGGLFIETNIQFNMGDELKLDLSLLSQKCRYLVDARVVWVNPSEIDTDGEGREMDSKDAHRNEESRPQTRVGVQFLGRNALKLRAEIQSLIQFSPTPNSPKIGQRSTDFKSL